MIEIHLDGKSVTPMEAARALNVTGGPHALIHTEREDGPQAKVYARFCGSRGVPRSPWLSCPVFTAGTAEEAREAAHVLSTAADLITLAGMLAAEQDQVPEPAEHDETANPDRAGTVRRAVELIDTATPADLRRYIMQTGAVASPKEDPAVFRAALMQHAEQVPVPFGTWKIAQQLLHAAGLPH